MERRSEPRIESGTAKVLECTDDPDLEGKSIDCQVIDFSAHGTRLQTSYALVTNTLLNITIGVGDPVSTYRLRGEVLWTEILENDCQLGVLFSREKDTDFDAWVALLSRN